MAGYLDEECYWLLQADRRRSVLQLVKVKAKDSPPGDVREEVLDTANLKLLERSGTITWRITLKPGEVKALTYRCERFVPSR